jgi:hypothetical protein
MTDAHWNLLKQIWGDLWPLVTLLIGVWVGAYVSNRNQRKQWLVDNKKVEYRELLTTVNESFMAILAHAKNPSFMLDEARDRELAMARTKPARTIADRILIADEINKMKLMERWTNAVTNFMDTGDLFAFTHEVNKLSEDIRETALKDVTGA